LEGKTEFGDNIEDEWFIVYLLRLLTDELTGVSAQVDDNDGEFLLIEAAEHIPTWLNPDAALNRVFFHKGKLHIIPPPQSPADFGVLPVGAATPAASLQALTGAYPTEAHRLVQHAISERLDVYPAHATASMHRMRCYLPEQIVTVLEHEPQLVSAATAVFYDRDLIDMRVCLKMQLFPPADRRMTIVKLSRAMYAQLLQQRFQPPTKLFGRPPLPSSPDYKAHDMGAKLAVGFEMLAARGAARGGGGAGGDGGGPDAGSSSSSAAPVLSGVKWDEFLANLKAKGYFNGNLEGSRDYKLLMRQAELFFVEELVGNGSSSSSTGGSSSNHDGFTSLMDPIDTAAHRLRGILADVTAGRKAPLVVGENRTRTEAALVGDDDNWMDIAMSDLEGMMTSRYGTSQATPPQPGSTGSGAAAAAAAATGKRAAPEAESSTGEDGESLESLIKSMSGFVNNQSTHEGAEFDQTGVDELDALQDTDDDDDDEDDDDYGDEGNDAGEPNGSGGDGGGGGIGSMSFDPFTFLDTLRRMAGEADAPDNIAAAAPQTDDDTAKTQSTENAPPPRTEPVSDTDQLTVSDLAELMDHELSSSTLPDSFSAPEVATDGDEQTPPQNSDAAEATPVNVDFNLVKNVLDSYSAQQGMAGPVSNILRSLGIQLPNNDAEDDCAGGGGGVVLAWKLAGRTTGILLLSCIGSLEHSSLQIHSVTIKLAM
jgi:hypothetical protein